MELGSAVKAIRLRKNLMQSDVAAKGNVALRSVLKLEAGEGTTVDTLVRVLKAMGSEEVIRQLAPSPTASPIAILEASQARRRVRRARPSSPGSP